MIAAMTCRQFDENVEAFLEGALTPEWTAAMRAHAQGCAACGDLLADLRGLSELLAEVPVRAVPAALEAAILQKTLGPRAELTWAATWRSLWAGARQPRFALGFGMMLFVAALGLNLAGVQLRHLRWRELTPARVWEQAEVHVDRWAARGRAYYNDLRVVYEVQATLRRLQRTASATPPPPARDGGDSELLRRPAGLGEEGGIEIGSAATCRTNFAREVAGHISDIDRLTPFAGEES